MDDPNETMSGVWKSASTGTARHILVTSFCHGWIVGEAALDNAQFFDDRSQAEAAARNLGERLTDAGDPSEISIHTADGGPVRHFIVNNVGWRPTRHERQDQ
jgi:hypothetical protein